MKRCRFDRIAMQTLLLELNDIKTKHLSMRDIRELFGRGRSTIAKWIGSGFLRAGKINGRLSFHIDDVRQFVINNSDDEIH